MNLTKWLRICFFNLMVIAAIGIILRYKILFALPFIDQKQLLHGHSHFAFCGWCTQCIMVLMISSMNSVSGTNLFRRYRSVLWCNLVCAYGMLAGFGLAGFGPVANSFTFGSITVSYVFCWFYFSDIKKYHLASPATMWFKAALGFNVISSFGVFALGYFMTHHRFGAEWSLGAMYYYLHFQYNGWFTFALLGLVADRFYKRSPTVTKAINRLFWTLLLACVPTYFLSALWLPIPSWVYVSVLIAAVLQFGAWWSSLYVIRRHCISKTDSANRMASTLLFFSIVSFSIKITLQLLSTVPSINTYVFGFRPVIVGYLHLVLLGFVTLGLLGQASRIGAIKSCAKNIWGLTTFVTAVVINEGTLVTQAIWAMNGKSLPYGNELLFTISIMMFSGLLMLNLPRLHLALKWRKQVTEKLV